MTKIVVVGVDVEWCFIGCCDAFGQWVRRGFDEWWKYKYGGGAGSCEAWFVIPNRPLPDDVEDEQSCMVVCAACVLLSHEFQCI